MVGSLHKPLFTEHSSVYFANTQHPPADYNNAYCKVGISFFLLESLPRITFPKIIRVSIQLLQNNVNLTILNQ